MRNPRLDPTDQLFKFGAARMAGHVHHMRAVGDDLDALFDQQIDDTADGLFIARNRTRGIDHGVALGKRHLRVLILGNARKRRARLALAAGAERHDFVGRQIAIGVHRAEILYAVEIARLARNLGHALHGAADHDHFTVRRLRRLGNRTQAPDIGRKCGDRHAAARILDDLGDGFADIGLRRRAAFTHGIGGIADEREAPSSPSARSFFSSVRSPRIGVGSIFQSPVCRTVPAGVRMMSAFDSGIECAMVTNSTSNGPTVKRPPTGMIFTGISGAPGSFAHFASSSAAVNGVA